MTTFTPPPELLVNPSGLYYSAGVKWYKRYSSHASDSATKKYYTLFESGGTTAQPAHAVYFDTTTLQWVDGSTGEPAIINQPSNLINGSTVTFKKADGTIVYQFDMQGLSSSGSTQTYIRTTHTGTILNSTQNRINRPDYDVTIGVTTAHLHDGNYYFRKIGKDKFRLRWHDQNEQSVYSVGCDVEIEPGVFDHYTLGVAAGQGDVQWDIDTTNGSGHVGFNPNNYTVMHNGKVRLRFSDPVMLQNGNLIAAGDVAFEWTYLAVGPFGAEFDPVKAKEGEQVTIGFRDLNPFPDSQYIGSYEAPDGTSGNLNTTTIGFGSVQVAAQKGHYKVYEAPITMRSDYHIIGWHKFVRGGKVNSNFW